MSRRWMTYAIAAGATLTFGAAPAMAQQGQAAADRDRQAGATRSSDQAGESTGETITDAWILTKVKAQFIGEDALKDSDINVDVRDHVVSLKGTVASQAGKARAAEIARATDGVTRVENELRVGMAKTHTTEHDRAADHAKQAAKDAAADTREESREARNDASEHATDAKHDTKQAAGNTGHEAREATGTAGQAVSDGWITTKVKASFTGVDVLDGSDINVDTNDHVVTLRGTVPSAAARAKAVSLAKQVDAVKSVRDDLRIAAKK